MQTKVRIHPTDPFHSPINPHLKDFHSSDILSKLSRLCSTRHVPHSKQDKLTYLYSWVARCRESWSSDPSRWRPYWDPTDTCPCHLRSRSPRCQSGLRHFGWLRESLVQSWRRAGQTLEALRWTASWGSLGQSQTTEKARWSGLEIQTQTGILRRSTSAYIIQ